MVLFMCKVHLNTGGESLDLLRLIYEAPTFKKEKPSTKLELLPFSVVLYVTFVLYTQSECEVISSYDSYTSNL